MAGTSEQLDQRVDADGERRSVVEVVLGVAVLAAWMAHAYYKAQIGVLPEMLWVCHVASLGLAVGMIADWRVPVAVGFLFHVSVGFPVWLADVIAMQRTTIPSAVLHLLTPLGGAVYIWRHGLPKTTMLWAYALYVVTLVTSRFATPPGLNVNVVFRPWKPVDPYFDSMWTYVGFNSAVALLLLLSTQWVTREIRAILRRKTTASG